MTLVGERYAVEWDLEKFPPLGKGSFGVVFKVHDTILNTDCALKRMPSVYDSFDDTKRVLRELRLLRIMKHDSILSITDAFLENDEKDTVYFTTPVFESPSAQNGLNDVNNRSHDGREQAESTASDHSLTPPTQKKNPKPILAPTTSPVQPATTPAAGLTVWA